MGRNRVFSFMSQFSSGTKTPPSSSPPNDSPFSRQHRKTTSEPLNDHRVDLSRPITPPSRPDYGTPVDASPVNSPPPRQRSTSRPLSMVFAHQPPIMDVTEDTIPELQPIFTFLNSHSNRLYQEGYFLKLDDQNTQGKPNPDRTWTECFAQLVGTVLSLWDAAELDAAGEDGEVLPKFINLTDASLKMIESLPTRSSDEQPLQNILSISTAGRNRYLLHFNSHHSLIQWTAAIRLAIYEQSTLQEAYTGALIAGKGKTVNNINVIMERSRFKTEEWVRVRFGAGVPWRRCWCVITPPDEKEYAKLQKEMKKRSPYDRSSVPTLTGNIKFYDTRVEGKKQKKAQPIATITDAYAAYAIYPQSKALIDASTLLKIEGSISIHTDPPSSTEGFVFIMPEVHPAVSGFDMLLRFLFPTWDTFGLYGRPGRLIASDLDPRSLMFAMPRHRRYGYLETLDVSNLILDDGSSGWNEKEWRKRLKGATGDRMNSVEDRSSTSRSRSGSRKSARLSFGGGSGGPGKPRVGFVDDKGSARSSRSFSLGGPPRTDSAPPDGQRGTPPTVPGQPINGDTTSDPNGFNGPPQPSELSGSGGYYNGSPGRSQPPPRAPYPDRMGQGEYNGPDGSMAPSFTDLDGMRKMQTPEPVSRPPAFNHAPQARPTSKAYHSPELRRANSRLSNGTLDQLAKAGGLSGRNPSDPARDDHNAVGSGPSVLANANSVGMTANDNTSREALSPPNQNPSASLPPPLNLSKQRSRSPLAPPSPYGPPGPYGRGGSNPPSRPGTSEGRRSPMPPGPPGPPGPSRSPHPQNPNYRPDQNRPPAELAAGGPDFRGRPPPNQRGPPSGPPSGPPTGPLPNAPYNNSYRQGPPRSPGPPGSYGPPHGPPHGPPRGPPRGPPQGHPQGPPRGPPQGPPQGPPMASQYRKPLPERGPVFDEPKLSTMSSSSVVTANEIIDHYAFDQVRPQDPARQGTPGSDRRPPPPRRQGSNLSGRSSHYDDDDSNKSIDYASTHKSVETQKSVEKPRAGVLKTVGGDEPEMPAKPGFDIPEINFGPTINYGAPPRSKTPTGLGIGGSGPDQMPSSSMESRAPPSSQKASGSPGRNESEEPKRAMAWQPGTPAPGSSHGLSAEQYVQQKAAHARTPSGNTLGGTRSSTPSQGSPGMKRNSSYDMLSNSRRHSRNSSADMLSRPGSRAANSALNFGGSGEVSSHLSAREQEQVAKMTGTSLINMNGHQRTDSQGSGLVGAIEAREREKQQIKPGAHSQAMQQAISQRQQQQAAMAYQQQMAQQQMAQQQMIQQQLAQQQMAQQQMAQQQMAQQMAQQQQAYQQQMMGERNISPQPMYSPMGRAGSPYGGPQHAPNSPPGGAYGQAASFSRPLRSGPPTPQQVDPRSLPPQGQYGAPGSQQTQRNVHPQYQGQAF